MENPFVANDNLNKTAKHYHRKIVDFCNLVDTDSLNFPTTLKVGNVDVSKLFVKYASRQATIYLNGRPCSSMEIVPTIWFSTSEGDKPAGQVMTKGTEWKKLWDFLTALVYSN